MEPLLPTQMLLPSQMLPSQMLPSQMLPSQSYRIYKLFRCYMAVGYIARYIWLCSHEIDGHVYMAK